MEFIYPDISQMNANGTHVPILTALLAKTSGPVMELGVGHYSTPLLNYHSKVSGRQILSIETSHDWNDYFANNFHAPNHAFFCTGNKLISSEFRASQWNQIMWDIVFVDCSPSIDRVKCIELFRNKAKYILVHDAEPTAVVYQWADIFDTFPNRFYWGFYGNGTIVVSMTEDCSWLS